MKKIALALVACSMLALGLTGCPAPQGSTGNTPGGSTGNSGTSGGTK